MGINFNNFIL